ncbi:hypothetical protein MKX03_027941 [Papaver bracteatum]|nr:hypothetical protein MKX03_027941 [Papaver bracteatum]
MAIICVDVHPIRMLLAKRNLLALEMNTFFEIRISEEENVRSTSTRYLAACKAAALAACGVVSAKLCISNLLTVTEKVCSEGFSKSPKQIEIVAPLFWVKIYVQSVVILEKR